MKKAYYEKALKKLTLIFLSNPVPFNGQDYEKQTGPGTVTTFTLQNKFRKIPLFCPFESGKCGKEGKKLQKFEYLENEMSYLDAIKSIFHSF